MAGKEQTGAGRAAVSERIPDVTHESNWAALIEAAKAENAKGTPMRGGKKYTSVAVRNEIARRFLGDTIGTETEIIHWGAEKGATIVVKATIRNTAGMVLATGIAEEIRGQGNVNQTSALENAETSAIGRALANLGLNGGEFASANEMDGVERKRAAQAERISIEDQRAAFAGSLEPPHDPETGEIPPPPNPAQSASDGLRDAWVDGIRDSLPEHASPVEFQRAVADALIAAFAAKKSEKGCAAQWDKRDGLIMEMQLAHPPSYQRVLDAFNARMADLREPAVMGEVRVG
jgi:hypothetical protein